MRAPRHCPPRYDCTTWAFDDRVSAKDAGHSPWWHGTSSAMLDQFHRWLGDSIELLSASPKVAPTELPDPSAPASRLAVGVVDQSTAHAVVARSHRHETWANGFYVGLVGQDPDTTWIGLTGFFIPWCGGCDDEDSAYHGIREWLRGRGHVLRPPSDLPLAIQEQPGWFDHDRLLGGTPLSTSPGLGDPWANVGTGLIDDGPLLVRVRPTRTSSAGMVLAEDGVQDLLALEQVAGPRATWTYRRGSLPALLGVADLPPAPLPVDVTPARHPLQRFPTSWGAIELTRDSGEVHVTGPYTNVGLQARQRMRDKGGDGASPGWRMRIASLPEGRAARWSQIKRLCDAFTHA